MNTILEAFAGASDLHTDRWVPIAYGIFEALRDDPEVLSWYLDLQFLAAWRDTTKVVGQRTVKLRKGQLIASMSFLCQRWRRSRAKIEPFLRRLEANGIISRKSAKNITIINICKPLGEPLRENHASLDANLYANLNDCKSDVYVQKGNKKEASLDANIYANLSGQSHATISKIIENKKKIEDSSSSTKEEDDDKLNFSDFIDFFNFEIEAKQSSVPKISSLNAARMRALRERAAEHGADALREAVRKAAASDWLNGQNTNGWTANFDWIFSPLNFAKILEGNYTNKKKEDNHETNKQAGIKCAFVEVTAESPDDFEDW